MIRRLRGSGALLALTIATTALTGGLPDAAGAAAIVLINGDGPGEGFNDPAPRSPVGGNPGQTIGEQRLYAFQHAIDIWAGTVDSPVEIRVAAAFDVLDCDSNGAVLGSAGPASVLSDFAGAARAGTWYPSALANALAGVDLDPLGDDIEATFNSTFGTTCPHPNAWYYGFDGHPPAKGVDFVAIVLHELGHGLGFLTFVNGQTGVRLEGQDDIFMTFLVDDRTGKTWPEMTNGERASAAVATGHLKWEGPEVVAASGELTSGSDGLGRVEMYAPALLRVGSSVSHWSDQLSPNELMEPSYTGPIHVEGLAVPAFADMGWALLSDVPTSTPTGTATLVPTPTPSAAPSATPTRTPSATPTRTPSSTPTPKATVTPTAAASVTPPAACTGDCNGDGVVAINELVIAVNIALGGLPPSSCEAADTDGNGIVSISELVSAVNRALNGC